jgi:hypothetical protein
MEIRADHRRQQAVRDPEAVEAFRRGVGRMRRYRIHLARKLAAIDRKAAFVFHEVQSAFDFAVSSGCEPKEAWLLLHLGRAMAADERLAKAVESGEVGLEQAAWLGKILPYAEYQRPGDDWVEMATSKSAGQVRRAVNRRIEEAKALEAGVPPEMLVTVTLDVSTQAIEDLRRCRILASRKAKRVLTESQTVVAVLRDYRERHDPLLQETGTRRVGPTAYLLEDRYIPIEARNEILRRSRDRCERCRGEMFLQFAHLSPHGRGSGREAKDLMRLCRLCHLMYDGGYVWHDGTWPEADFVDAWGNVTPPPWRAKGRSRDDPPPEAPGDANGNARKARGKPPPEANGAGPAHDARPSPSPPDCEPPVSDRVSEPAITWNGVAIRS